MVRTSKTYIVLIATLALVLIALSSIPIYTVLEYDPPSVFNEASGGLSRYFLDVVFSKGVDIIYSFSELSYYAKPSMYALLIVGPDKDLADVKYVVEWVRRGGIVVVLDEYNGSLSLLKYFGFDFGTMISAKASTICELNNTKLVIYLNVFREVKPSTNSTVLCRYGYVPIAVSLNYGNGKIIVVGDSSLIINEIAIKASQWYRANMAFIDMLTEWRHLIIFEGARVYSQEFSYVILRYISAVLSIFTNLLKYALEQPLEIRALVILIISFLSTVYTMSRYGYPRKHELEFIKSSKSYERIYLVLKDRVVQGVEVWRKTFEERIYRMR